MEKQEMCLIKFPKYKGRYSGLHFSKGCCQATLRMVKEEER